VVIKNGQWKVPASILAAIVSILVIVGYISAGINEKIENKIIAHEKETEAVHQKNISEIKQDVAVIKVQQQEIKEDISELKDLIRSQ